MESTHSEDSEPCTSDSTLVTDYARMLILNRVEMGLNQTKVQPRKPWKVAIRNVVAVPVINGGSVTS